jgi:hypothetical protein
VKRGYCSKHHARWLKYGDPLAILDQGAPRFWARVNKDGPVPAAAPHLGPCWLWTGTVGGGGYGQANWTPDRANPGTLAHRVSYALCVGRIPDGLTVDHLCFVLLCVNPAHLEPVTLLVNIQRRRKKPPIEQCKRGHEFTPENTRIDRRGGRVCRKCHAQWQREDRQRRKAAQSAA